MIEAIGFGVFVFVVIVVAGNRAIDTLKAHKAKEAADRLNRVTSRAGRVEYTGQRYNVHGREIDQ
jgi:hypothetical protein